MSTTYHNSILGGIKALTGAISSTFGSFLNIGSQTYTDNVTGASSTSTGNFSANYLAAPTLAATNTAVTTPVASTLTIAGAPITGTNETITNAYTLYVIGGLAYFGGNVYMNASLIKSVAREFCGRFYLTTTFTPSTATTWYYMPNTFGIANDIPPSLNAIVSGTNVNTSVNLNSTTGLLFLPVAGRWSFNMFGYFSNISTSASAELRLSTYSTSAWTAAGSVAKTYGTGQTANTLAGTNQATLATSSYMCNGSEIGLSYSGIFPAGTLIAPLVNFGSTSSSVTTMYIEAKMDYALQ